MLLSASEHPLKGAVCRRRRLRALGEIRRSRSALTARRRSGQNEIVRETLGVMSGERTYENLRYANDW